MMDTVADDVCGILQKLETDKAHVETRLGQIERERQQFAQQNTQLNAMSGEFKKRLDSIETQQKALMNEKRAVEKALRENTEKMGRVEQERDFYHKQADGLKKALDVGFWREIVSAMKQNIK